MGLFNPPPKEKWTKLEAGAPLTEAELEEVKQRIKAGEAEHNKRMSAYLVKPTRSDTGIIRGRLYF